MIHATRAEAFKAGAKTFFTGLPCKRGHVVARYVTNGGCVECGHPYKRVAEQRRLMGIGQRVLTIAVSIPLYYPYTAEQLDDLRLRLQQLTDVWYEALPKPTGLLMPPPAPDLDAAASGFSLKDAINAKLAAPATSVPVNTLLAPPPKP